MAAKKKVSNRAAEYGNQLPQKHIRGQQSLPKISQVQTTHNRLRLAGKNSVISNRKSASVRARDLTQSTEQMQQEYKDPFMTTN